MDTLSRRVGERDGFLFREWYWFDRKKVGLG